MGHLSNWGDFGLSKLVCEGDVDDETYRTFCGTYQYIAPEMLECREVPPCQTNAGRLQQGH